MQILTQRVSFSRCIVPNLDWMKMEELSEPIQFNRELCLRYKNRLAEFYYSNMKLCSCMNGFSFKDAELKIDGMTEHVANGTAFVFGVFDEDTLVGFIWAYEHPFRKEVRVYVNEIHVTESYRNRGIGKRLLSAVEGLARQQGYGALYIHAEGDNEKAIRLYQNEGYVVERVQLRKEL